MAFGLFERFITVECPVYVRPTLEGVHRGLKVPLTILPHLMTQVKQADGSCWIFVFIGLNLNFTVT